MKAGLMKSKALLLIVLAPALLAGCGGNRAAYLDRLFSQKIFRREVRS